MGCLNLRSSKAKIGDLMETLPLLLSWLLDVSETKLLALVALGAIGLAFYVIRLIASR